MENLEFYGETRVKAGMEGYGYYVTDYESVSAFDGDPELKEAFIQAKNGMKSFYELLDKRIIDLGGDPNDYDA